MPDYLVTDRLSLSEKRLLYSLRVRMAPVRNNYRSKYGENLNCQLCNNHLDNQENLLKCFERTSEVSTNGTIYNDIYGTLDQQVNSVKIWKQVLSIRNSKLRNKSVTLI